MKHIYILAILLSVQVSIGQNNIDLDSLCRQAENYPYRSERSWDEDKEFYRLLKNMANGTNDERLLYHLGVFKKEGVGTTSNVKRSRNFFKQAFEAGYTKAAYPIGYYHLKGLGDVKQNYNQAYQWFKKSETPLGQHWMAKMHYFGLGKPVNKNKALKLLEENDLYNSEVLLEQFKEKEPPNPSSDLITKEEIFHFVANPNAIKTPEVLGKWEGEMLQLDWSKERLLRVLPISMEFEENSQVTVFVEDSTAMGNYYRDKYAIQLQELEPIVSKDFTDYPNFTHHLLHWNRINFYHHEIDIEGEETLIGSLEATIPLWHEDYYPTLIVLKKKRTISQEAQEAFAAQAGETIKTYPNPFEDDLLVNFELGQISQISLHLENGYGTPTFSKSIYEGTLTEGNKTITVTDIPAISGYYTLTLRVNGAVHTKTLIRN